MTETKMMSSFTVLMADDDDDDRFLTKKAFRELGSFRDLLFVLFAGNHG